MKLSKFFVRSPVRHNKPVFNVSVPSHTHATQSTSPRNRAASRTQIYMAPSSPTSTKSPASSQLSFLSNQSTPQYFYDSLNTSSLSLSEQQEEEDLDENVFYTTLKKDYPKVFHRVSVVCVPHSRSIVGLKMTRAFIETHCLTPSPYFQGQFMSVNGKVVSIERNSVKGVSGFKEERSIRILGEELVYNEQCKVQVLTIERPLEGEGKMSEGYNMCIPTERNHESDMNFLQSFPNNTQSLMELRHMVAEFSETYVYVPGFAGSVVEKITRLFKKAVQNILASNSTLYSICKVQHEYEYFLELVENVLMGELHTKIFTQALCPLYNSYDNYLESIIAAYARARITLRDYGVSERLQDMPEEMLRMSCDILSSLNEEYEFEHNIQFDTVLYEEPREKLHIPSKTPLEKLISVKHAIQEIANAADTYLNQLAPRHPSDEDSDRSSITTDDFIPLLAYVIVHSRIRKLESALFYMQTFRISKVERSELGFALTTLGASTEFLKSDPLAIHDSASTTSSISSSSFVSSRARGRSISLSTPPNSVSPSPAVYQSSNPRIHSIPGLAQTNGGARRDRSPAPSVSSISSAHTYHRNNSGKYSPPNGEHHKSASGESTKSYHTDEGNTMNPQQRRSRRPSSNLVIKPPILLGSPKTRNSQDSDRLSINESVSSASTNVAGSITDYNPPLLPSKPMISSPPLAAIPLARISDETSDLTPLPSMRQSQQRNPAHKRYRNSIHAPEIIAVIPRNALTSRSSQKPIIDLEPPGPDFMGDFLNSLQGIDGAIAGSRSGGLTRRW